MNVAYYVEKLCAKTAAEEDLVHGRNDPLHSALSKSESESDLLPSTVGVYKEFAMVPNKKTGKFSFL